MDPLPLAAAQDAPGLRIGEMAKISGFSVKTIRFYCDQGLLHTARSEGRYRIFSSDSLAELEIIRALRSMDVPIGELARILEVRRAGVCNCSVLKDSIATKLLSIDSRIQELQMMKSELARLLSSWQDCGGAKAEDAAKK
ncbi:MerR family transcriptional regulator [Cyanobium sp. Maggiore-St4-Cus]|jgi:DNA-binding transcriptional MerR regulator|uniref:MerR family transcriptional regulator n=1 Tax=Cyanobium sp. Maggiore-St4-Cus TaxID=2823717 RepID=UPI0020CFCB08|nr:MerR family transcriptional regulator [Cyanobium sp. Maggiore-St4-Cus]